MDHFYHCWIDSLATIQFPLKTREIVFDTGVASNRYNGHYIQISAFNRRATDAGIWIGSQRIGAISSRRSQVWPLLPWAGGGFRISSR